MTARGDLWGTVNPEQIARLIRIGRDLRGCSQAHCL